MLNTDPELKNLYKSDSIDKNLILDFYRPGFTEPFLHIGGTGNIMGETMEIDESLSSGQNIEFGSCEASQLKVTLVDVHESVKGTYVSVYQTLDGMYPDTALFPGTDLHPSGYTMPLGKYVVQSEERQANRKYSDLVALDFMSLFDVNVIDWYNSLAFPMTLRQFRASLCAHVGVTEEVPDYLPNDDMLVDKSIDTADLIGRNVLIAIEQANGAFGHFDRNGVLQHVVLQPNDRLVPSMDLLPDDGLFPQAPGDMNTQIYDEQLDPYLLISCIFEEHTVKSIDKVQIRQEEGDIGAIYGSGTNAYTVDGNFLMYGKTADELEEIAQNIYGMVSGRMYIPFESESKGLPYLEVGDAARFEFGNDFIVSYIIKRTLKGIYALRDSYSATGEEIRSTESNINTDIIQLKGRAAILKKNVDEVSANLTDLENASAAKFAITAEQISMEVKRAKEAEAALSSSISITAEQIALKVSKGEVSAQLSIESDGIEIVGDRFSWYSTYSSMTPDGRLNAVDGTFSGAITGGSININDVFTVNSEGKVVAKNITVGTTSTTSAGYFSTLIADSHTCNNLIVQQSANIDNLTAGYIECSSSIVCSRIYSTVAGEWWSDKRLKHDVIDIPSDVAASILSELRPVSFRMNEGNYPGMGFIAQEVIGICDRNGIDLPLYGAHDGFYTIPYTNYIPVIVSALKGILKDIEEVKRCIR